MEINSLDQKLNFIISELASLKQQTLEIAHLVNRVTTLEAKVEEQNNTIKSLKADVLNLKIVSNVQEQQLKANHLRLLNFPGSNDETGLAGKVYEVLKPLLAAAKLGGLIPTLPQMNNTFEEVYRAGRFSPGSNKPPPPIILKCSSALVRLAILKTKKQHLPPPEEEGAKRLYITEDLTPATHRKLKELAEDERVEKVWTLSGSIWVVPVATKMAKRIKSPFKTNDKILS
jgi:hypothetical protein